VELNKTHKMPIKGDVSVLDALTAQLPVLNELSTLHMTALRNFVASNPNVKFHDLHEELFSVRPRPSQEEA